MVEHESLCLHLLQVLGRVGVHLRAVRRWRHTGARTVHLVRAELRHAELEEGVAVARLRHATPSHALLVLLVLLVLLRARPVIVVVVGQDMGAERIVEVLGVQRLRELSRELLGGVVFIQAGVVEINREVEVQVVEVEQIAEVGIDVPELLSRGPCWIAAVVHITGVCGRVLWRRACGQRFRRWKVVS
jgi:hypothetical protein